MGIKGLFDNLDVVRLVLAYQDGEVIWTPRPPEAFKGMPYFWRTAIAEAGAEDIADDICEEMAHRWNTGDRVGKRPAWHKVNKSSRHKDRFYVKLDQSMLLDDAIAEALDVPLVLIRASAAKSYTQAAGQKPKLRQRRLADKTVRKTKNKMVADHYSSLLPDIQKSVAEACWQGLDKATFKDRNRWTYFSARGLLYAGKTPEEATRILIDYVAAQESALAFLSPMPIEDHTHDQA